jgi:hypothetical protein
MLNGCFWDGEDQICEDLFELVQTDEGFCCSFNSVPNALVPDYIQ